MKGVSLFSGIGGIEWGLAKHGIETVMFCEIDPVARAVLSRHFPHTPIVDDVRKLRSLPDCDIVTAGFPCQDLSQAGFKRGIEGSRSGLVSSVFDLIRRKPQRARPRWLLIENVPYMLSLDSGRAMSYLTQSIESLGYRWAYRVVDARSFGRPQRRPRVLLLASTQDDPADVLFADIKPVPELDGKPANVDRKSCYGFYWTEGSRGVGWVREGVPPIKCGSTVGIASPPAVWIPARNFVGTIDIRDAERLQGFPEDWTSFEDSPQHIRPSLRWRLVGNAVSTEVANWLGRSLTKTKKSNFVVKDLDPNRRWPEAGTGQEGSDPLAVESTRWATGNAQQPLSTFLRHELKPLSLRATSGFLGRARRCSNVVYSPEFLKSLERHIRTVNAVADTRDPK